MDLAKHVEDLLSASFQKHGINIVAVNVFRLNTGTNLQVLIERVDGSAVNLDECVFCNKTASVLLDVENLIKTRYTLEVSSPGEYRPLTKPRDYEMFAGKCVKVELHTQIMGLRKFKGVIKNIEKIVDDFLITFSDVVYENGVADLSVKFGDIKKATLKRVFEIC